MNLFSKYKKLFLVLIFLAITFILGFLLYRTFFQSSLVLGPEPITITPTTTPGSLPISGEGTPQTGTSEPGTIPGSENIPGGTGINQQPDPNAPSDVALGGVTKTETLTSSAGLAPTLSNSGGIQYYNKDDGYFYKIDVSGNAVKMSDRVFYNVEDVTWAPNKNKAVLEYPDNTKILYNFETKKQVTIPSHWEDFDFSPQSDQIIAKSIALDPDNRFLTVASDDGSRVYNIEEIGLNADKVKTGWSPNNQIVATYAESIDLNRQEVFFVGLNGENFKSTTVEGRGLVYEWSKTGDRLLYSAYNTNSNMKPLLWVVDAQGDNINKNRISLGINTWADKCTFATNTEVYCAVPVDLEVGSGLIRALADDNPDELYKIDLRTGTKTLVAIPDGQFNMENLIVNNNQSQLFFSDKNTGLIHKINLK